jgi:hypothetical protein
VAEPEENIWTAASEGNAAVSLSLPSILNHKSSESPHMEYMECVPCMCVDRLLTDIHGLLCACFIGVGCCRLSSNGSRCTACRWMLRMSMVTHRWYPPPLLLLLLLHLLTRLALPVVGTAHAATVTSRTHAQPTPSSACGSHLL